MWSHESQGLGNRKDMGEISSHNWLGILWFSALLMQMFSNKQQPMDWRWLPEMAYSQCSMLFTNMKKVYYKLREQFQRGAYWNLFCVAIFHAQKPVLELLMDSHMKPIRWVLYLSMTETKKHYRINPELLQPANDILDLSNLYAVTDWFYAKTSEI